MIGWVMGALAAAIVILLALIYWAQDVDAREYREHFPTGYEE